MPSLKSFQLKDEIYNERDTSVVFDYQELMNNLSIFLSKHRLHKLSLYLKRLPIHLKCDQKLYIGSGSFLSITKNNIKEWEINNISHLYLNYININLSELRHLQKLTSIKIIGGYFELNDLIYFPNLTIVEAGNESDRGIHIFPYLSKLKELKLWLDGCGSPSTPYRCNKDNICNMVTLEKLWIKSSYTDKINLSKLTRLRNLTLCNRIKLSKTLNNSLIKAKINTKQFAKLPTSIETLYYPDLYDPNYCAATGILYKFINLKYLKIVDNDIWDTTIDSIIEKNINLTKLKLTNCMFITGYFSLYNRKINIITIGCDKFDHNNIH